MTRARTLVTAFSAHRIRRTRAHHRIRSADIESARRHADDRQRQGRQIARQLRSGRHRQLAHCRADHGRRLRPGLPRHQAVLRRLPASARVLGRGRHQLRRLHPLRRSRGPGRAVLLRDQHLRCQPQPQQRDRLGRRRHGALAHAADRAQVEPPRDRGARIPAQRLRQPRAHRHRPRLQARARPHRAPAQRRRDLFPQRADPLAHPGRHRERGRVDLRRL